MLKFQFINGLLYTIGWLACVTLGAEHQAFIPILIAFAIVVSQLYYLRRRSHQIFVHDVMTIGYCAVLGLIMEIILLETGTVNYATTNVLWSSLPPGWIWSLYFLFALTYNHALNFLNRSLKIAALFGALGGALSYFAGSKLGAVVVADGIAGYPALALAWGIYLSLTIWINRQVGEWVERLLNPKFLERHLTVFIDPLCPICSREISYLKKRKKTGSVEFVELSAEKKFRDSFPEVDYMEAMKEIHALDSKGCLIKGTRVFSELYARVGLPWLAVAIELPGCRCIFKCGYKIWARWRIKRRCKIAPLK